jgi:hypothetical protein
MSSGYINLPLEGGGGGGGGVTSLNSLTGALTLLAGPSITITPLGNTLTISSTALPTALISLNGSTFANQTLVTGTAGTDFAIVDTAPGIHTFNLPTASATVRGALSSADWSTFNSKQPALTFGSISSPTIGVTITNGSNSTVGPNVTLSIATASASATGLLTSTDWTTFNTSATATTNATALSIANTIVKRDASKKFAADGLYDSTSAYTLLDLVNKRLLDSNGNLMIDLATPTPSGSVEPAATVIAQLTKTSTGATAQFTIQNDATGGAASTDFIVNQDTSTDFNNYADFGINSSTFSDPSWTINGNGDAYIYNNDGGLAIGANAGGLTAAAIKFFTGGTLISNLIAQFNSLGVFQLGPQTGSAAVKLQFVNSNTGTIQWAPSSTVTLTIPPAQGAAGTVLQNDGTGVLSWAPTTSNIDGGSPSTNYTTAQNIIGGTP